MRVSGARSTHSLESSLISTFFWHPVAGLAMLSCGLGARGRVRRGNLGDETVETPERDDHRAGNAAHSGARGVTRGAGDITSRRE